MKRSVGLLFFALTFVVLLLSCGISVTEGARLLKQNYDDEDAGDEIEMNAMQRKTTKNEEDDDQAAIYAAKLEEEEIENTQLNNEEESELEQVEEEVAKEASEMSSSSSSSSSEVASSGDGENTENMELSKSDDTNGGRLSQEEMLEEDRRMATKVWEGIIGQPEGKEKDLIDKIVEAHSLACTPMDGFLMENAYSEW